MQRTGTVTIRFITPFCFNALEARPCRDNFR
jgi:hypothetical protein